MLRLCKNCGKEFTVHPSNVKRGRGLFCSRKCFDKYYQRKPQKLAICQYCGRAFLTHSCRRGEFCSEECYRKHWIENILPKIISKRNGSVELICENCGKRFKAIKARLKCYNVRFCSKRCFDEYKRRHPDEFNAGSKHWNWKGGVSEENHQLRHKWQYRRWREAVLRRDNYTCRLCGYRGHNIVAHHIYDFSEHPELRFDVNNGITLCRRCHKKLHYNADEETINSLKQIVFASKQRIKK